jgi:hypothetical protein
MQLSRPCYFTVPDNSELSSMVENQFLGLVSLPYYLFITRHAPLFTSYTQRTVWQCPVHQSVTSPFF